MGVAALGLLSPRLLAGFEDPVLTEVPPPPADWAAPLAGLFAGRSTATTIATLLPSGLAHVVEVAVAPAPDEPNVLWFLLQEAGIPPGTPTSVFTLYCAAPVLPPFNACLSCPTAPYQTFAGQTTAPNPNFAQGQTPLVRSWLFNPTYYVRVPQGVAGLTASPFGAGSYNYTYQEFLWDVAFTVAKYSAAALTISHPSLPTQSGPGAFPGHPNAPPLPTQMGSAYVVRSASFGGLTDPNACPPTTPVGVAPASGFSWPNVPAPAPAVGGPPYYSGVFDDSAATNGPTGDSINEFLWMTQLTGPSALPMSASSATSMVIDVFSGAIIETDVIFNPQVSLWPIRAGGAAPSANCPISSGGSFVPPPNVPLPGPGWTTVFDHEVGHFFGLQHSNLFPGLNPPPNIAALNACDRPNGSGNINPYFTSALGVSGSCNSVTTADLQNYADVPGMSMITGTVNYWRTSPSASLHPDDELGVAELYPVSNPGQGPTYSNVMINDFGRIEGSVGFTTSAGTTKIFGMNVFPLRNDCDYDRTTAPVECAYPPCPPSNVGSPCAPRVGKVSGTARLSPNSVLGAGDTQQSLPASGEFQIHGVAPTTDYYVKIEPLETMGYFSQPYQFPSAAVAPYYGHHQFGEWFSDLAGNVGALPPGVPLPISGNPPMTFMGPSSFTANTTLPGYFPGLAVCEQVLLGRRPFPTSLGSLFVAPGTVLTLNIDLNRGRVYRETVSRPVIQITPRLANWTVLPQIFNVTATVVHDYQLNVPRCNWVVNGTIVSAGAPTTTTQPNPLAGTGPWTTTWTRSSTLLGITPGSQLRFMAQELSATTQSQQRVPPGITATVGVNEVQY